MSGAHPTPADIERMARASGLLHGGPADDDRARLTLAALGEFARQVRAHIERGESGTAKREPATRLNCWRTTNGTTCENCGRVLSQHINHQRCPAPNK